MITPVAQWHWCHNSSHGEQRCCNPLGWSACICSDEAAYDNPNECHWRFVAKTQGPSQLPVAAQRGLPSLANGSTPTGLLPPCPLQATSSALYNYSADPPWAKGECGPLRSQVFLLWLKHRNSFLLGVLGIDLWGQSAHLLAVLDEPFFPKGGELVADVLYTEYDSLMRNWSWRVPKIKNLFIMPLILPFLQMLREI